LNTNQFLLTIGAIESVSPAIFISFNLN